MTRVRLLPGLVLAAGLFTVASGSFAQPGQPIPVGRGGPPPREAAIPLVPKSAGAFVTLKVSDLAKHPDLKPVLAELAKQPEALDGITEALGVSPLEIDRVTLFWPRLSPLGPSDPVLVVTTREPFNEARVLKALRADPVFDGDFGRGHGGHGSGRKAEYKGPTTNQNPPRGVDPKGGPEPFPDKGPNLFPKGTEPKLDPPPKFFEPPPLPILPPPPSPFEKKQEDSCGGGDDSPGDPLFYELHRGPFEALFLIDETTLLFLPGGRDGDSATIALLASTLKKNATGPLADAISTAGKHTFAAGANLAPLFREFNTDRRVPRELVPYTALFAARTAVITGNLDKGANLNLALTFEDATAAKRAAPVLEEGIADVAKALGEFTDDLKPSSRSVDKAAVPLLTAFVAGIKKATVKADGTTVTASAEIDAGPVAAKALGELLQAVQSRRKAEKRMNNLKQIGLAIHNYYSAHNRLPANVYGPKGEPLLSWRVHLLPYLEQDALYKQFKLDEPWDSENNKKLIEKMPDVFRAPDREHAKGKTFYLGFIDPDPLKAKIRLDGPIGRPWLREGVKDGITFAQVADGTSNTLAVIEARDGVIWSKPEDLPFGGPVPALGEKGWDRTPALRLDGSVVLFPTNLKPEVFWQFVTINGGEVTPDIDDDRSPLFRPRRYRAPSEAAPGPATAPEPAPATPAAPPKPNGLAAKFRELSVLEYEIHVLELALKTDEKEATEAVAEAARVWLQHKAGNATAEETAKARGKADEARKVVQARKDEITLTRAKYVAALDALGKESIPAPKK